MKTTGFTRLFWISILGISVAEGLCIWTCYKDVFHTNRGMIWWVLDLILEKEMATHSSVLAWRIPGTGEPVGLPSMGSHRVRHDWSYLAAAAAAVVQWEWAQCIIWLLRKRYSKFPWQNTAYKRILSKLPDTLYVLTFMGLTLRFKLWIWRCIIRL